VVHRKDSRHPQLARFLELIAELRHRERWLDYDPDRDWLPDVDLADLAAAMPAATHDNRTLAADQPARPARRSANGA
jgi:hypothetical protein